MSAAEEFYEEEEITLSDFQALGPFVEENPQIWATMSAARWAINNRHTNDLDKFGVLIKRNGRILVVKPRIIQWLLASKK
jgi:hypothetical protein